MNVRPIIAAEVLLGIGLAALMGGGCAAPGPGAANDGPRHVGAADGTQTILPAELDELTRAFADRYVGLLSSACDALKKDNPDPVQRREAQVLMADCAANVYDIASNADAFTRMLDLVVVTTLVSQVWIDDDRAAEVFPGRDEVLVRALHHGRVEAWALAAQVLRPDQLDLLDYLLWDWRRHNPHMVRASFVRFSTFAIGRGKSANAEVLAAGGFFAGIGQAGQSIDEARLLTERMFYLLKREPTVLRWQVAAMRDDMVATPEVGQALADVHRLTDQAEQLPKNVAAERQAIVAALDERLQRADATVASVRATVGEARGLVTALGPASSSLNELFKTADALLARYDTWDRWATTQPGRLFDIREYTQVVRETASAAEKMSDLLRASNALVGSPEWDRRVQQVSQSADERMKMASQQSQLVVDAVFARVYLMLGVFCAMFLVGLVAAFLLMRRLIVMGSTGMPQRGRSYEAGREVRPAPNARGAA